MSMILSIRVMFSSIQSQFQHLVLQSSSLVVKMAANAIIVVLKVASSENLIII